MNKFIHSTIVALAVLAILSYGTSFAHAQTNSTSYPRDHDRDHFGVRGHFGLGPLLGLRHLPVVVNPSTTVVTTTPSTTTPVIHRDFDRFHNFALNHRDHFLLFGGRYVILPGFSACPLGTQLNQFTGECQVVNQVILQQQAPIIQQQQIQVDPSTIVQAPQSTTTVTTNSVAPIITCPAGSTQVNGQCQVTTESTQTVAPLLSCQDGFSLSGGQCVEQQQQIVVGQSCGCPAGSVANSNGQCVVSALPSQVTVGTLPSEIIVLGHHFHHEGNLPWIR